MDGNGVVFCRCGLVAKLTTCWKDDNPGRRFLSCPLYPRVDRCNFFRWHDPEMGARAVAVIPGLLHNANAKEIEIRRLKKQLFYMQIGGIVLMVLWLYGLMKV
ncbi:Unknown protein [Striga hermonthica]|uniref:GRF-type domain-containing protein n=1 Tax=Striga hermonthica TaxID=68872 RepID=A0A9N7MX35_STRHE|nr:Unknown protein [Striga hermonthica]